MICIASKSNSNTLELLNNDCDYGLRSNVISPFIALLNELCDDTRLLLLKFLRAGRKDQFCSVSFVGREKNKGNSLSMVTYS
ncbi:hypothetical protein [Labilibaculum manganireducens]|uniref:hypothetical protein n=1 Tax=Labilibaculum manganireducens TaxID=1940525 RepID=UPI0029F5B8B1|nr:hypothetical protein [Labilibaculum manganireducens]